MSVSIVIPVYNEAAHLPACLAAIAQQTVRPYEVIVVDNNSSDDSMAIASSYDFVTIVQESRQGVVHARNCGFDRARGTVIGRIDADTMIAPDWVATLERVFMDPALDAVSGSVSYHDLPWKRFLGRLDLSFRQWVADGMAKEVFLFGSNMALRRTAWRQVRGSVCSGGGLHEDFDLAIHLHARGAGVMFDRSLHATISLRRFNTELRNYWEYVWLSPKTYALHGRKSHYRMYPVVLLVVAGFWIIQLLYRSYNPYAGTLSLKNLWLVRDGVRVNPATFVD